MKQYSTSRDKQELLFAFNKRTLFAVNPGRVFMTTKLDGHHAMAALQQGQCQQQRDAIRSMPVAFIAPLPMGSHIAKKPWLDKIIPRLYTCKRMGTRRMVKFIKGKTHLPSRITNWMWCARSKFLIMAHHGRAKLPDQHSAGSGKVIPSPGWPAYRLSGLHNDANRRIFDSAIVVTDRKVLDQQFAKQHLSVWAQDRVVQRWQRQSAIGHSPGIWHQHHHHHLQKFPFVIDKVGNYREQICGDHRQGPQLTGRWGQQKWKVLSAKALEDAITASRMMTICPDDYIREQVERSAAASRQRIFHFCIYGYPKYKTPPGVWRKRWNKPKPPAPVFLASGHEEGFIWMYWNNTLPMSMYFKLTKAIERRSPAQQRGSQGHR